MDINIFVFHSKTMTECNRTMMIFKTPPVNESNLHTNGSNDSSRHQRSVQEESNSEIHVSYYLGMCVKLNMIVRYIVKPMTGFK